MRISIIGTFEVDGNEDTGLFIQATEAQLKTVRNLYSKEVRVLPAEDASNNDIIGAATFDEWYSKSFPNASKETIEYAKMAQTWNSAMRSNPWCRACSEEYCMVDSELCEMLRVYQDAKTHGAW